MAFGIGIIKSASNVLPDGCSTTKENVSLLTIIVNNGIILELVPLAMLDMYFKEVTVPKETHSAKQAMPMEPVPAALVATFWIMEAACPSPSSPT